MCRCSEMLRRLWLAVLVCLVLMPLPARADDRPPTTTVPQPLPQADTYPVVPLTLPSTRIAVVTQDAGGAGRTKESEDELDVLLNANVLFGKDSAVIRPAARARLAQIAALLADRAPGRVEITGYTDDLGSAEHGLVLSRQRAKAVRAALASGLGKHRVTVRGRGEADPLVPNTSEANRAKNRRVEVKLRG